MNAYSHRFRRALMQQARGEIFPGLLMVVLLALGLVARYVGWLS